MNTLAWINSWHRLDGCYSSDNCRSIGVNLKIFLFVLIAFFSTSCSTHTVSIIYTGNPVARKGIQPSINKIIIVDNRERESNLLGSSVGGYGNSIVTLRTDKPIRKIVEDVYKQALTESGFFNDKGKSLHTFKGEINKLYCIYKWGYEGGAIIKVSLIDNETGKTIFQSTYRDEQEEPGIGLGIAASVDTLREVAEEALNNTVNETITDPEFIKALNYTRPETAGDTELE